MAVRSPHSPPCNTGGGPPSQSRRQCCDRLRTQLNWAARTEYGMGARSPRPWPCPPTFPSNQVSFFLISQVPVPRQSRRSLGALVKSRRPGPAEEGWAEEQQRGSNNNQQQRSLRSQPASQEEHSISERDRPPEIFWVPDSMLCVAKPLIYASRPSSLTASQRACENT